MVLKVWTVILRVDVIVERFSLWRSPTVALSSSPRSRCWSPSDLKSRSASRAETWRSTRWERSDPHSRRSITSSNCVVELLWATSALCVCRDGGLRWGRSWWSTRRGRSLRSRGQSSSSQVMRSVWRTSAAHIVLLFTSLHLSDYFRV